MKTPASVAWSCMRTRSPSSAPPENGDDGSTARTPTRSPRARNADTSADVVVDLPTPGAPVSPMMRALPVRGASAAITGRSSGAASSTSEMSRATARAEPSDAASTRPSTSTLKDSARDPEDQRVALPAAAAQRGRAGAATAAAQLEREVQRDARAGHADRVTERDGAAVDVDLLGVEAEVAHRLDADRRERLVDLDEVEVAGGEARTGQRLLDGIRRLALQRRIRAGDHTVVADL